jgi:hypothetical protein
VFKIKCEYCGRPILEEPKVKNLKGKKHTFCSGFCFRLFFYDVPAITYEDLKKMYAFYCISVPLDDFQNTIHELLAGEV